MKINFIDLKRQYRSYQQDIDRQIAEVLTSGSFIMGPKIHELEKSLGDYVNVKHAISCSSGTDALLLGLMALDIQPGDEVITTPFSFIAACEVIAFLKAKPVFVDIDESTYNINADLIEAAITPRTRGIIPVDLFGQCADYDRINAVAMKHGLFVIEDAAQAFGAEYKGRKACGLARLGCTSFFPAKPLGCYGDGGMVFADDPALAERLTSLRLHGQGYDKYDHVHIGINGRLDHLQAAVLLVKFAHYEEEIQRRNKVAATYSQGLAGVVRTPVIEEHNRSVFAQYCVRTSHRNELQEGLRLAGIPTAIHYPKALHQQPVFKSLDLPRGTFPVAESVCEDILALPMHPFLERNEMAFIIDHIKNLNQKGLS